MSTTRSILILFIGLTIGFGIANKITRASGKISFSEEPNKEKLTRLIDYIEDRYVDQVNTDSIVDYTVTSILSQLDPHSTYIPKSEMADVKERMQGDFVGIGVNYWVLKDTMVVISTIEGGPSAKAGVLAGDRILLANQDTLYGEKAQKEQRIKKLKGAVNSDVAIQVYRPEIGILDFNLKREVVPIKSVEAAFMLNDTTGYIKIERFAETTFKEYKAAFLSLPQSNLKSLILDLRGNGGGYVKPALQIADEFLEDQKLIMFTKDRNGAIEQSIATAEGDFEQGNLYVLIDENSASASEILAGALQDQDKATIVGRRSFGKGLVQQVMELGDGSSVRLTVSQYYTPTGRSIQRPYEKGNDAYFNEYLERYDSGELKDSTKLKVIDSLAFKTPKGKIVYGGGGIIPDIYVEQSEDRNLEVLEYGVYAGVVNRFVFNELEKHRSYYNDLSLADLLNLEITDSLVYQFKNYSADKGLEFSGTSANLKIKSSIKAEMAKQLHSSNTYYQIILQDDDFVKSVR